MVAINMVGPRARAFARGQVKRDVYEALWYARRALRSVFGMR